MHSNKMQERLNAQGGVIVDRDAQPTITDRDDSLFASSISAQVAPKPLSTNGKPRTFLGSLQGMALLSNFEPCRMPGMLHAFLTKNEREVGNDYLHRMQKMT